jgi:valyl-tRNA synthetase
MLITEAWSDLPPNWIDPSAESEIGWVVELVSQVRSVRAEMNVPPGARIPLTLVGASPETAARLGRHADLIQTLGRIETLELADVAPQGSVPFVIGEATAALSVAAFIDLAAEKARLSKDIANYGADIDRTNRKLLNPDFLAKAKDEVIEENRERLAEAEAARSKLQAALKRLETVG